MKLQFVQPKRLPTLLSPSGASILPSPFLVRLSRPRYINLAFQTRGVLQRQRQRAPFAQNARPTPALAYPERLLIYHTPTPVTSFIGLIRAGTIVFFGIGCLFVAPSLAFSDESSTWLVPVVMAGAAVPMTLVHFMTVPYVVNVFIRAPITARRSRETMIAFARRLPADTKMEFQTMGLLPLPRTRGVLLSEMRTLPPSPIRLANLDHVPGGRSGDRRSTIKRMTEGHLYTGPSKRNWEKTPAPDVWQLVLDQIEKNSNKAADGLTLPGQLKGKVGRRVGGSGADKRPPAANTVAPRPQQLRNTK